MPAEAALAGPPEVLRTGPLALAASEFWRARSRAHHSLWTLGYLRIVTPDMRRTFLSEAVEAVEDLRTLAETGHPKIRCRAAAAVPNLLSRITAFVEPLP